MTDKELFKLNVQAVGVDEFARFCSEQFNCPPIVDYELCKYMNDTSNCFECWKNYIEKKIAPCKEPEI